MRIGKKFYIGAASLLVAAGALVAVLATTGTSADALTMGNRRDCGYTDTIIDCGTTTSAELLAAYDSNNDRRGNRDIQTIFHHYGIKRSDITGQTSTVVKGWLNTNGVISVNGKTVATGAQSLYRVHPGKQVSRKVIGGKTYYSGPVAGSYTLGADVFVFLNKDGTFRVAIQASCGNPIAATNKVTPPKPPAPKPVYKCESLKAQKVTRTEYRFTATASVQHATVQSYTFNFGDGKSVTTANRTVTHEYAKAGNYLATVTVNVRVDGKTKPVTAPGCRVGIKVEEKPKVPVYRCESLKAEKISRTEYRFTAAASATHATIANYTFNFGDGKSQTTTNRVVTHEYAKAGTYTATVTVNVKVNGKTVPATSNNCKVTIKVEEKPKVPVYKCENLTAKKINRTQYRFTATASATHAEIVNYTFNFGDGNSETTSNREFTHEYDEAGTYTATVTVNVRANGQTVPVTSDNCKVTIKVDEKPVPSISIDKTVNGKEHIKVPVGTEFTYEITVRNTGNIAIKDAVVTDNAPSEVTLISAGVGEIDGNTWTHTIPELKVGESKSFAIKAVYKDYAEGTHKNRVCVETPTVPGGPECDDATTETDEPIEVCDLTDNTIKTIERSEFDEATMTTDLTQCDDIEVCIIEDKTIKTIKKSEFDEATMTTDLSKCEEVEIPPELPKTGLEALLGGGLGIGSITAAGYYWSASRRNLLDTLLKK